MKPKTSIILPDDYPRIRCVSSLEEIFNARSEATHGTNVVLFRRGNLAQNFNKLANVIGQHINKPAHYIREPFDDFIANLKRDIDWDDELEAAADFVATDMKTFAPYRGAGSALRVIGGNNDSDLQNYFHADGGLPWQSWRLMSCYNEPATEWLKNEDAVYDKDKDRYVPKDGATIYSMQAGDVWFHRRTTGFFEKLRPPLIHRATTPKPGEHRLLFAS